MKLNARHLTVLATFLIIPAAVSAAEIATTLPAVAEDARTVDVGGMLRLQDVHLDGNRPQAVLELRRVEVFTHDARIIVDAGTPGEQVLAPPDNRTFLGKIAGDSASSVLLTVRQTGDTRGIITSGGEAWMIGQRGKALAPTTRKVDVAEELARNSRTFTCGTDALEPPQDLLLKELTPFGDPVSRTPSPAWRTKALPSYTARIGIETDFEFYQLFGNTTDATDYIADVIAYDSGVYSSEIATSMLIQTIYLYTSQAADPWTQTSTLCLLMEFGRYWNDNRTGVDRTIAHFMSGKNNGGGVAWVGVLCYGPFNTFGGESAGCPGLTPDNDNYGGGYGYTGNMSGSFDIDNPSILWDIVATSHEMGHNFSSSHTHCYAGVGGVADPVDECYNSESGCYAGATSLPGPAGQGSGTLMSYCHLLSPGMSNISFTFGEGHPYGVAPERVGQVMFDHVVSRAASDPSCLAYTPGPDVIFSDGFERGNTNNWSSTSP